MAEEVSLHAALLLMGAPTALVEWAQSFGDDFVTAWEAQDSPADLVWVAGAASLSLTLLTECVLTVLESELVENTELAVRRALEVARDALSESVRDATRCDEAAQACDALAKVSPNSFREFSSEREGAEVVAAGHLARMAEGLVVGRLRNESHRYIAALNLAATVGGAGHAFLSAPEALRLIPSQVKEDAFQDGLLAIVESGAAALRAIQVHRPAGVLAASIREFVVGKEG